MCMPSMKVALKKGDCGRLKHQNARLDIKILNIIINTSGFATTHVVVFFNKSKKSTLL